MGELNLMVEREVCRCGERLCVSGSGGAAFASDGS